MSKQRFKDTDMEKIRKACHSLLTQQQKCTCKSLLLVTCKLCHKSETTCKKEIYAVKFFVEEVRKKCSNKLQARYLKSASP